MPKKAISKPLIREGFALLNKYGDVWANALFDNAGDADAYLRNFWNGNFRREEWRVIEATMTIAAKPSAKPQNLI